MSGKTLNSIGMSRHFELLYNMGIQLLHCGKAMPAFDCLVEAVQVFRSNPRLWLRLAECCIMVNREVRYLIRKKSFRVSFWDIIDFISDIIDLSLCRSLSSFKKKFKKWTYALRQCTCIHWIYVVLCRIMMKTGN